MRAVLVKIIAEAIPITTPFLEIATVIVFLFVSNNSSDSFQDICFSTKAIAYLSVKTE